jgi:hypothetical protein
MNGSVQVGVEVSAREDHDERRTRVLEPEPLYRLEALASV